MKAYFISFLFAYFLKGDRIAHYGRVITSHLVNSVTNYLN